MRVKYVGGHDAQEIVRGVIAERGGPPVEVDDKLGKELVARGDYERTDTPERKRAAQKAAETRAENDNSADGAKEE